MLSYFIRLHIIILIICQRVARNFFKYNVLKFLLSLDCLIDEAN